MKYITGLLICLIFAGFVLSDSRAHAQDNTDEIAPLDQILNPDMAKKKANKKAPVTPADYGSLYFEKCTTEDDPLFTPAEKEIMCSCTAANMTELLSVKEFKALEEKNAEGFRIRQNVLLYAYAPCMPYIARDYARKDCFRSPLLENIRVGKEKICMCAGDYIDSYLATSATYLIEDFNQSQPDKIDFLRHFFMSENYEYILKDKVKHCLYKKNYERDN